MMDLHDLILIAAAFVVGFCTCYLLRVWADHRAKPYLEGWQAADKIARECQLKEAYRIGQDQACQRVIDAPVPYQWN